MALIDHSEFAAGAATTSFIERHFATSGDQIRAAGPELRTRALAALLLFEARGSAANGRGGTQGWSSTGLAVWPLRLAIADHQHQAHVSVIGTNHYMVVLGSDMVEISIAERSDGEIRFTARGLQQTARFAMHEGTLYLDLSGTTIAARETTLGTGGAARKEASGRLVAPMNGAIVGVHAREGDSVSKGQRIVVLEAMKMQHEICAERDGVIEKILIKPGDQVATRQVLVELKADVTAAQKSAEVAS